MLMKRTDRREVSPPPPVLMMIIIDSRAKRGYRRVVEPKARLSNEPEASECNCSGAERHSMKEAKPTVVVKFATKPKAKEPLIIVLTVVMLLVLTVVQFILLLQICKILE